MVSGKHLCRCFDFRTVNERNHRKGMLVTSRYLGRDLLQSVECTVGDRDHLEKPFDARSAIHGDAEQGPEQVDSFIGQLVASRRK